jgi:protein phosphatase
MPTDGEAFSNPAGLDVGQATDVGKVREHNEDALLAVAHEGGLLLVAVADGMGGHKAGEVASGLAVDSLRTSLGRVAEGADVVAKLTGAVKQANGRIWDAAAADDDKEGMGTTLVCALVSSAGAVCIANVGDSRAYTVVDDTCRQITIDHTWVNQQVIEGQLSEREARTSPYRNLLTRSLGNIPKIEVDVFSGVQLEPGNALVLVSDGVTGYLEESDIATILRQSKTAQQAAERLVRESVRRGGADNATAVVVRRT